MNLNASCCNVGSFPLWRLSACIRMCVVGRGSAITDPLLLEKKKKKSTDSIYSSASWCGWIVRHMTLFSFKKASAQTMALVLIAAIWARPEQSRAVWLVRDALQRQEMVQGTNIWLSEIKDMYSTVGGEVVLQYIAICYKTASAKTAQYLCNCVIFKVFYLGIKTKWSLLLSDSLSRPLSAAWHRASCRFACM